MLTKRRLLSTIAAASAVLASNASAEDAAWVDLFDGTSTAGWTNPYEWGEVKVVEGEVHLKADKKFFLVTEKQFGDFEFEGEIKLPQGKANSGFMFRCNVEKNRVFGYQAEVDGSERRWSGGLYDEGRRGWIWPPKKGRTKDPKVLEREAEGQAHFKTPAVRDALNRSGWNKYRIVCKGDHIQIFVNGVKTTDLHDDTDASGPIGIQHHGEKGQIYQFRNLRIRPMK